jgi:hypothetical protein
MPPALAARFTQAEMAALRIIADEVRHHGVCGLHIDAIAARAGTCRTTVKNALREARRLNLVTVQERRRRGQKSLTNLVRIVSPEWMAWMLPIRRIHLYEAHGARLPARQGQQRAQD